MKQILAKLFGAVGGNIADKISNIIDKHTFSKVEKAQFEKEMTEVWINAESDIQKNVTERWKNDMNSDSWLSKNVRPIVLIFLVVSTVLMVFIDAGVIEFEVKSSWIDLLQLVLITVIGSYFGGRSYEKINRK
jgi:cation transport ATPase